MSTHSYKNPQEYNQNNSLQYDFAMRIISSITVDKSANILDLGCGDGLVTSKLAQLVPSGNVIGTDISEQMIEYAKTKYSDVDNMKFECMDASKNKFENQFNLITSFNAMHWVKDQQIALEGIAKSAMKNAEIVLLLSHKKSNYHYAIDRVTNNIRWNKYFDSYINPRSFWAVDQYQLMLEKAGITVFSINEEEMIYHFKNREALKDFARASMSYVTKIPDSEREEFLDDFCQEFLSQSDESADLIPLGFRCLVVFAKK